MDLLREFLGNKNRETLSNPGVHEWLNSKELFILKKFINKR